MTKRKDNVSQQRIRSLADIEDLKIFGYEAVSTKQQVDKISLTAQKKAIDDLAARYGGRVVHHAVVPGHSRNYQSFEDMEAAFREDKISALEELQVALTSHSFNVLAILDADRIAREQPPFGTFVLKVIASGAIIYCINDGLIVDQWSAPSFIAFRGYYAAEYVRGLKERYRTGTDGRAASGLPATGKIPFTHIVEKSVRRGDPDRLIVNEAHRRLFDDIFTLLLEGVAFNLIGAELYKRFGHVSPTNGKPFVKSAIRDLLHNPNTWGHVAQKWAMWRGGEWAYDPEVELPPDVVIYRNQFEPVWSGEQGQSVIAELKRRKNVRGRASSGETSKFLQLMVCADCGRTIGIRCHNKGGKVYYGCIGRTLVNGNRCANKAMPSEDMLITQINDLLNYWKEDKDFDGFDEKLTPTVDHASDIQAEITEAGAKIKNLIRLQSTASETVSQYYSAEIETIGQRLAILRQTLAETVKDSRERASEIQEQKVALDIIREYGDNFWSKPNREINQALARFFGKFRLKLNGYTIVTIVQPREIRKFTRRRED